MSKPNDKPRKLMSYDVRHAQFLNAGKKLVSKDDYSKVTAAAVAKTCACTGPLVFAHFGDRDSLRAAVREFIKNGKVPAKPKVAVKKPKPKAKKAPVAAKPVDIVSTPPKKAKGKFSPGPVPGGVM